MSDIVFLPMGVTKMRKKPTFAEQMGMCNRIPRINRKERDNINRHLDSVINAIYGRQW